MFRSEHFDDVCQPEHRLSVPVGTQRKCAATPVERALTLTRQGLRPCYPFGLWSQGARSQQTHAISIWKGAGILHPGLYQLCSPWMNLVAAIGLKLAA